MTTLPVSFSHVGIHVTDLAPMEDFYTRVLGLLVADRGSLLGGPALPFLSRAPDEHYQMVQPFAEPLDIEAPAETILAQTEALRRSRPGFMSRGEWREAHVERTGAAG